MKPFYGKKIDPDAEAETIKKILSKYRKKPVSDELKKNIYYDLCTAKAEGVITIPFKVILHKREHDKQHDYIEVLLDTKV